jgi:hypothetical protein
MQSSRLLEIVGSFLLGGGVVAVGYELARAPQDGSPAAAIGDAAVAEASADPGAEPDDASGADPAADPGEAGAPAELDDAPPWLRPDDNRTYAAYPELFEAIPALTPEEEAEYTHHALVTSLAAIVRERADLESPILGILRGGTRMRVKGERIFGGGCEPGWAEIHPYGFICRKAGLAVGETPPDDGVVQQPDPQLDQPLPYEYWRVNDEMTPFFHRLPSFEEQNLSDTAGQAWFAEHKREPMPLDPSERPKDVPAVVREYMNAGFYVTKAGEEIKSQRRFLRTTRGAYARKYQLGIKEPPTFQGLLIAAEDLPLYFIRREMALMKREGEGSDVLVTTEQIPERLATHPFVREIHMGPKTYYEDEEGMLMRSYAVGKAYKLKRPPGVEPDERWVHIDLSEQTLVAYIGDEPVFVTLVSTGKEPGMTPVGVHRVQIKHVATSMRDQPIEDEAYSIDDVPWTQYFAGSIALHGAFWHAGFGLVRSHGCVNLSPADARWLFGFTEPRLPEGWHAIAPLRRGQKGSPVVVTE